jgi:hypothetical protein
MNKRLRVAWRIWRHVIKCGPTGATANECAEALKQPEQSVSPRVSELWRHRLLIKSTLTRPTSSGGVATIMFANKDGDFKKDYADKVRHKAAKLKPELSLTENEILGAGKEFVGGWKRVGSEAQKQRVVLRLVRRLQRVAIGG